MGATVSPIFASKFPGAIPGGSSGIVPAGSFTSGTGQNSLLPGVTPTTGVSSNPYSAVPSFPANAGPFPSKNLAAPGGVVPGTTNASQAASSPLSFLNTMSPKDISRMFGELKKTYGDGTAHMILDFLTGGAGFNQAAINNLLAALQPGIERGTESIMEQFSAMGNRFGSPAALGLGDYLSEVQLNEGQIEAQMYEQSIQNFINVLMGTADKTAGRIANSPSTMDSILGGLKIGGAVAGEASAAGVGGPAGTILDILAAAGAAA